MKSKIDSLIVYISDIVSFTTNSKWFSKDHNVCWMDYNFQGKPITVTIPFQSVKAMYLEEKVGYFV